MGAPPAFDTLLRRARRDAGLTQEELAERAGLSARVISDLERGVIRAPRPDTLDLLAGALALDDAEKASWQRTRRQQAKRGARPAAVSPARSLDNASALPEPITPLVGRSREVEQAARLIQRPGVRLLTLTGTGGIGKTRLAIEVARTSRADAPSSTRFINLAPLSDSGNVLPAIASALGVSESGERSIDKELSVALSDSDMLMVLDNFEHVVDAADAVAGLLAACPGLTFLVTSRVPLHIQGEHLFPVPPMALPDAASANDPERLLRSEATVLFIQRAQAVRPNFRVTDENARTIAELCRRLDGLPLAIELAAARVSVLSPQAILQLFDRPLQLLTGGARDLPDRQRTLRDTIRWSYDLLQPDEQQFLRELSAFAGGWTLKAAEAVTTLGGTSDTAVLDCLIVLREHSLLRSFDDNEELRFGMLDTIREFARAVLESGGEATSVRDRHARYFHELAEDSSSRFAQAEDIPWADRLEREHDNLRGAIAWLLNRNDTALGLRLCGALGAFWYARGFLSEGRAMLEAFLDHPDSHTRSEERARALHACARLAVSQDDGIAALGASQEALSIRQELGIVEDIPGTLVTIGLAAERNGDRNRSRAVWQEAARLAPSVADWVSLANSLNNLGVVARDEQRPDEARELFRRSLKVSEDADMIGPAALALRNLGDIAAESGEYDEGLCHTNRSLNLYATLKSKRGIANSLEVLASMALKQEQLARGVLLMSAAESLFRWDDRQGTVVSSPEESPWEAELDAAQMALGDAFEALWERGSALTVEEAVAEALRESAE